jgi:hypothetical protein
MQKSVEEEAGDMAQLSGMEDLYMVSFYQRH